MTNCMTSSTQGYLLPTMAVSCSCSPGTVFFACTFCSAWSSCMAFWFPIFGGYSMFIRQKGSAKYKNIECLLLICFLHSGPHVMLWLQHHCLLHLSCFSVYISKAYMVRNSGLLLLRIIVLLWYIIFLC